MLCQFSWENPGTQSRLHVLMKVTFCLHPLLIHSGDVTERWLSWHFHLLCWCAGPPRKRPLLGGPVVARPAKSITSVHFPKGLVSACMSPCSWPYGNPHPHLTVWSNVVSLSLNLSPCCPNFQTAAFTL